MQDFHGAADNALIAADARRVLQRDRLTFECFRFYVNAHLAILITNIAIDAFSFFRRDFELRPAAPKIHPEGEWTPHSAPNSLSQERIQSNRDSASQGGPHPDVVQPQRSLQSVQVGDRRHACQANKHESNPLPLSRRVAFRTAMPKPVANSFRQRAAGTNVRAINLAPANRDQRDHNKGQYRRPNDSDN